MLVGMSPFHLISFNSLFFFIQLILLYSLTMLYDNDHAGFVYIGFRLGILLLFCTVVRFGNKTNNSYHFHEKKVK